MRIKGTTIQQIILGLALLVALCWNLAQANEIKGLHLADGPAGTRAELQLQSQVAFRTMRLSAPERFVVDLPDTAARNLRLPAPAGIVKSVRTGQPAPGVTRIVFDLTAPVAPLKPRLEAGADGARLVVEWPGDGLAKPPVATTPTTAPTATTAAPLAVAAASSKPATPSPAATSQSVPPVSAAPTTVAATTAGGLQPTAPATPTPASPANTTANPPMTAATPTTRPEQATAPVTAEALAPGKTLRDLRSGTRPLIIAIDAGHGGQDPGAIGPTGKREKDVTLAIARELARQVNATPGLKAFLTRDSDMFLPLHRRGQLARQAKADIFISIHADAAENRSAKGSSVYVLSTRGASSQRARWLADKENASDLIGGVKPKNDNTLASVLLDLTQSGQMKASEDAANQVLSGLKNVGYNHKPNIERANFAVLRTSDMPAMLVETAFISNADEERRLVDPTYQRNLARAVLQGVDTYFTRQPPPGTLYAARAKALESGTVVASAASVTAKPATTGGSP
ncbi:N-acetylmuramoyl-L-alanine amidase [Lysobacter brunescens]|uniref:N-acetylmuramoyl-L-alanine amidase n=1 Tax=Lysobacter brunescens TaxID=262323 RepID=A0ABW2YEP4_9GAMM